MRAATARRFIASTRPEPSPPSPRAQEAGGLLTNAAHRHVPVDDPMQRGEERHGVAPARRRRGPAPRLAHLRDLRLVGPQPHGRPLSRRGGGLRRQHELGHLRDGRRRPGPLRARGGPAQGPGPVAEPPLGARPGGRPRPRDARRRLARPDVRRAARARARAARCCSEAHPGARRRRPPPPAPRQVASHARPARAGRGAPPVRHGGVRAVAARHPRARRHPEALAHDRLAPVRAGAGRRARAGRALAALAGTPLQFVTIAPTES